MRILHTSDWHIGECRRFEDYLDRHRKVLTKTYELAIEHKVDLMTIGGDIFHRLDTTHAERDLFYELLAKYDGKVRSVIISGNHDETTADNTQLNPVFLLSANFKSTVIVSTGFRLEEISPGEHLLSIPWCAFKDDQTVLEDLIRSHMQIAGKVKTFTVLIHGGFYGYQTDSGYRDEKGMKLPHIPGVTLWLCGDIHKMQRVCDLPHAWYCGAPAQWTFGDAYPKGVLLFDTMKPTEPLFLEVPSKKLIQVSGIAEAVKYRNEDAFVKIVAPQIEIAEAKLAGNLPANVVITEGFSPEVAVSVEQGDLENVCEGLADFLRAEGLTAREIGYAEELVAEQAAAL